MRWLSLFLGLSFLLFSLSFSACHTVPVPQKQQFNAYLPHPFDDYFTEYIPSESTAPPSKAAGEWDLSKVDISYINPTKKLIAFTFDDAPSKTMERIFAVFAEYNEHNPDCKASATVFYNGGLVDEGTLPHLHTAHIMGMELGNHTQSHLDLTTLSNGELKAEIDKTDEILARVDGQAKHLLRAPFGRIDENIKTQAETPIIDWTIDTLDWTGASENEIYDRVWKDRFSGGIVLMHDGYEHTVSAVKRLLPDLKADGYQVVSVSAMAKAHACTLKRGGVYIRLRKH